MEGDEASVKDYLPKEKQFLITRYHIVLCLHSKNAPVFFLFDGFIWGRIAISKIFRNVPCYKRCKQMEYKASQELLLDSEDPEVRPLFFCLETHTLVLPWSKYDIEDPEVRLRVLCLEYQVMCCGNLDKFMFISIVIGVLEELFQPFCV